MDAETAAKLLGCGEEEEDFHERFLIIQKMNTDTEFAKEVVKLFNPPYYA